LEYQLFVAAALLAMNLPFPAYLRKRSYIFSGSSSSAQWEDWRSSLSLAQLVGSRRVRLAVAAALAFLLLIFFLLPQMPVRLPRNPLCPDTADVTDWSQFAYSQYVTNPDYLCNSVMAFEALDRLRSKAARVLMYPSEWSVDPDSADQTSRLLLKANLRYNATLVPITVQRGVTGDRKWSSDWGHTP